MMSVRIPISIGELFDKISILENKSQFITEDNKLKNIHKEYTQLRKIALKLNNSFEKDYHYKKLKKINRLLWDIEEHKRECETRKDFGDKFIELARKVYMKNDERASIKRKINEQYGSSIIEEKSYKKY